MNAIVMDGKLIKVPVERSAVILFWLEMSNVKMGIYSPMMDAFSVNSNAMSNASSASQEFVWNAI